VPDGLLAAGVVVVEPGRVLGGKKGFYSITKGSFLKDRDRFGTMMIM
jgi:hypothetical protein